MGKKLYLCKLKKCSLMNNKNNGEFHFAKEYYIFREVDILIANNPSNDINTSDKDYNYAVKNYYEWLHIYIKTSLEIGTLWDDLKDHSRGKVGSLKHYSRPWNDTSKIFGIF